jgi:EAL domain-containing protein (putative c-di-GMP-specific phosphodiesterase class I)
VRDVTTDKEDQAVVDAIIRMAHRLGLKTIAEGVETDQQLDYLTDLQCDEIQGYLFGRPVPPQQFPADLLMNSLARHSG